MQAIRFENVSKRFILHHQRPHSFQELLINALKGNEGAKEELWALKDVSFAVEQGETLGIIGENGSGKSTILKLIARILEPTEGEISVKGSISALLELGAGFHPDLTGRENIYLNGSLLGLSKREMDAKFDQIVEFSELGRFIDVPVKHYSSGMYMRLGFSVAANVDPDVLLIDEVLAVGDEAFQKRCVEKIGEFKRRGKTSIFVSHSMKLVRDLCDRAIWLDEGLIQAEGATAEVVEHYLENVDLKERARLREVSRSQTKKIPRRRWGSREVEITAVQLLDNEGNERGVFETGERMVARIHYYAHQRVEQPVFGVAIHRSDGVHVNGPNTRTSGYPIEHLKGKGMIDYIIDALPLLEGTYLLTAAVYDDTCTHPYDHHDQAYGFEVQRGALKGIQGIFHIPCRWELRRS